jgi:hypothetical protein
MRLFMHALLAVAFAASIALAAPPLIKEEVPPSKNTPLTRTGHVGAPDRRIRWRPHPHCRVRHPQVSRHAFQRPSVWRADR